MMSSVTSESQTRFKGKYISDPKLFRSKKQMAIFSTLSFAMLGPMATYLLEPLDMRFFILLAGSGLVFISLTIWSALQIRSKSVDASLEMDINQIRIQNHKTGQEEIIPLSDLKNIRVDPNYKMPGGGFKYAFKELFGTPERNYIDIREGDDNRRIYFIPDSYYHVKQLQTLTEQWKERGYFVSYLSDSL